MTTGFVRTATALLLALSALTATAAEMSRTDALAALGDRSNVERRREAAVRLADIGTMGDIDSLIRALRDEDVLVRTFAERAMWQIWSHSGDADIDRRLALGIEQMASRAGDAAVETFTRIIQQRPDFAEGWNKRATVYYLMGEYEKSLQDCDEVMKRNPNHFGALSGYGLIHTQLGNPERALDYFERALRINPNLESVKEAVDAIRQLVIQRRRNTL